MQVEKVFNSAMLESANYDPTDGSLTITFVKGGVYKFDKVPEAMWHALCTNPSAGRYFLKNIRDKYSFTKMN